MRVWGGGKLMIWAVAPLKNLVSGKTRLSGVLAPSERHALAKAMAEDLLSVLVGNRMLEGILLISDDPSAERIARKYAIEWLEDVRPGGSGLNDAVAAARELLRQRGVQDLIVLHSDLPLLQPADIDDLLHLYAQPGVDVVIAPDLAGMGTNILLMPMAPALDLHYGGDSCPAHQRAAAALNLQVRLLHRESTGLDVDSPGDLLHVYHRLQEGESASHCSRLLLAADVARRLAVMERGGLGLDPLEEQHGAI